MTAGHPDPSPGASTIDACRHACAQLCTDFVSFIDNGREEDFIALFTEDGVFSRATGRFEGHDGLRRFLAARPANVVTRHLCTNVHVDRLSETQARGTCTALMFQSASDDAQPAFPLVAALPKVVDYTDEFVLTAEGWRFKSRSAKVIFTIEGMQ